MSEGIQETKEVLAALDLLAIDVIKVLKKHGGAGDVIAAVLADEDLKNALVKAQENVTKVPAELGDLQLGEIVELAMDQAKSVPALLAALKG
jgi:hypothetical protein